MVLDPWQEVYSVNYLVLLFVLLRFFSVICKILFKACVNRFVPLRNSHLGQAGFITLPLARHKTNTCKQVIFKNSTYNLCSLANAPSGIIFFFFFFLMQHLRDSKVPPLYQKMATKATMGICCVCCQFEERVLGTEHTQNNNNQKNFPNY